MHSQNLKEPYRILHYRLLERKPVHRQKYSFLEGMKNVNRKRNLLLFSIVYGTVIGSIVFLLLNA